MSSEFKYGRLERSKEDIRAAESAYWKAQPWWTKALLYTIVGPAFAVAMVRQFTHPDPMAEPVDLLCFGAILVVIVVLNIRDHRARRRGELPPLH